MEATQLIQIDNIVRCPECKGKLNRSKFAYSCQKCSIEYPIKNGIPILLPLGMNEFKKAEAEHHSKNINTYDKLHQLDTSSGSFYIKDRLSSILSLPNNSSVLEVGCGTGTHGIELMKKGYRLVETDISYEAVMKTYEKAKMSNVSSMGSYIVADAENLPFATNAFDGIFTVSVLHHLPNPREGISEARRCIKPNGLVMFGAEPNKWWCHSPFNINTQKTIKSIMTRRRKTDLVSIGDLSTRGWNKTELIQLLNDSGLAVLKLRQYWYLCSPLNMISRFLKALNLTPNIPSDLEKLVINIDEFLAKTPLINRFNVRWSVVAARMERSKYKRRKEPRKDVDPQQ